MDNPLPVQLMYFFRRLVQFQFGVGISPDRSPSLTGTQLLYDLKLSKYWGLNLLSATNLH